MVHLRASEVQQLLHNKFVVVLGDSVQRAVYKDLVLLLQKDCLLTYKQLKTKGELSFEQDKLVAGGLLEGLHNGTNYREVREFRSDNHLVRFYFVTRVYSDYLEGILQELHSSKLVPDLVIMNSCLWDISRYGRNPWRSYLHNLESLFGRLNQVLPRSCLLVWNTAMPVGDRIREKAILGPNGQYQPTPTSLKVDLVKANFYSWVEARKHHFDVLDLHFHFRHSRKHLQDDGVHWNEHAHRQLSQLLLAHVADAWGVELPRCTPECNLINSGPDWEQPDQVVERQPQANWAPPAFPLSAPGRPPKPRPLLRFPSPLLPLPFPLPPPLFPPPQPLPIPFHQARPRFPPCPQDSYFTSDDTFQSDQFYFHSDDPSSTQTGFAFKDDFTFGPQQPLPSFPSPCYQQRAPVVHRGFPRNVVQGPYLPKRGRPRRPKGQTPAHPQSRPQ